MQRLDKSTFVSHDSKNKIEVVVGDEKQADFFPRVKLKKWNNELNLSIGLADVGGNVTTKGDKITYEKGDTKAEFYPTKQKDKSFDKSAIRYINTGAMTPTEIAARYEIDRTINWAKQTIEVHWSDRPALMYYGYYHADSYVDFAKLDIPEIRVAARIKNNPMYMDSGLPLIDVHYDLKRDKKKKIRDSLIQAATEAAEKRGAKVTGKRGKLYFEHKGKQVKYFSVAFIDGHYYAYFNLSCDYNKAYDYYADDPKWDIRDVVAHGLDAVIPEIDHTILDEIIKRYAELYGLPLETSTYSREEQDLIKGLLPIHEDTEWVRYARRNDVYFSGTDRPKDGFEFGITLNSKPTTNEIPLTIQTKNLRFAWQGEPTKEQAFNTYMPSYVRHSFAVYHANKRDDEYGTGKAFHIYRPWAEDASGKKVWCSMHLDQDADLLTITVPQSFLNNATYPVFVDPTFGYTTNGGSNYIVANAFGETIVARVATGEVGTISSISSYILIEADDGSNDASSSIDYKYALYRASDGALIAQTAAVNQPTDVAETLTTLDTTTNPVITTVPYWITVAANVNGGDAYEGFGVAYDLNTTTVGQTSDSGFQTGNSSDYKKVSSFVAGDTGRVTSGGVRCLLTLAGTSNVRMVIYSDSSGSPNSLLAVSDDDTITNTSEAVKNFTFSGANNIVLTSGVTYWIGLHYSDPGSGSVNISCNIAGNSNQGNTDTWAGGATSTFGTPTGATGVLDAYVTIQSDHGLSVQKSWTYTTFPNPLTSMDEWGYNLSIYATYTQISDNYMMGF